MGRRRTLTIGSQNGSQNGSDADATREGAPALGARLKATRRRGRGRRAARQAPDPPAPTPASPRPAPAMPVAHVPAPPAPTPAPRRPAPAMPVARAPRPPFLADEEPSQPTRRFWVPGTDAGPGTMLLLPDAREGVRVRAFRLLVLVGCFLAGGALATVAFPWVETALDRAVDEVRSVTEAGFAHSPDPGAAAAPPAGSARP